MTAARNTIWTTPEAFDDLVRSTKDAVVERGTDEAGTYYALMSREGTEWKARPVSDAHLANVRGVA